MQTELLFIKKVKNLQKRNNRTKILNQNKMSNLQVNKL